ncbi:hypothetical protein SCHPADRAFT_903054 [Schizopora paradoxa]|uniref:Uncharacterized protein n=1 Tax=Schizopora paradoxa TaxID=27342 RepID=A0A0H2SCG3_9AGAM|nr:hypothetical protein SCHPADRAFT_903054 [Schizopora paradoxa]
MLLFALMTAYIILSLAIFLACYRCAHSRKRIIRVLPFVVVAMLVGGAVAVAFIVERNSMGGDRFRKNNADGKEIVHRRDSSEAGGGSSNGSLRILIIIISHTVIAIIIVLVILLLIVGALAYACFRLIRGIFVLDD